MLTFLSLILGIVIWFRLDLFWGVALGMLALIGTVLVHRTKLYKLHAECDSESCVNIDRAVTYLGWQGTLHRFEIASQRFACNFMAANQSKLVNLTPEAMALLSSSGVLSASNASRSPRRYLS
ncbi:MAG TPA: hypothetical protein VMQ60_11465 [Acidobacteriaceae bacterium]|nr:hypothetical protein [Acidobacteriaceae bacterium]